jgi:hypothetical protein
MKTLLPLAETIARRLIARRETIAVAESSTGGLIAASLLAVPGASAYFLGGAVVYTKSARSALLGFGDAEMEGHAGRNRSLCAVYRAACAGSARRDLGPRRNRRHRTDRQPLWRSGRSHLYRSRRAGRACRYSAHRQRRPAGQYGSLRQACAGNARRGYPGKLGWAPRRSTGLLGCRFDHHKTNSPLCGGY